MKKKYIWGMNDTHKVAGKLRGVMGQAWLIGVIQRIFGVSAHGILCKPFIYVFPMEKTKDFQIII